jgi:hypothetical protein
MSLASRIPNTPAKYYFHASGQVVGLDVGPSTIAIVSNAAVGLGKFAPSVVHPCKESRRLQRALSLMGNFGDGYETIQEEFREEVIFGVDLARLTDWLEEEFTGQKKLPGLD